VNHECLSSPSMAPLDIYLTAGIRAPLSLPLLALNGQEMSRLGTRPSALHLNYCLLTRLGSRYFRVLPHLLPTALRCLFCRLP
jgi:hypothetical protein